MTYDDIIHNLYQKKNFSFSRFGDGEWNCMLGKHGANCDGHTYFSDLGEALQKAWDEPRGVVAVQRLAREQFKIEGDHPDADVIHRASINGELDSLFTALSDKDVVLVGPKHLSKLGYPWTHVITDTKNAWMQHRSVKTTLQMWLDMDVVILYCCGMMAEVLIWELYNENFTQIDIGSAFDPYVGVKSRMYHNKLKI